MESGYDISCGKMKVIKFINTSDKERGLILMNKLECGFMQIDYNLFRVPDDALKEFILKNVRYEEV